MNAIPRLKVRNKLAEIGTVVGLLVLIVIVASWASIGILYSNGQLHEALNNIDLIFLVILLPLGDFWLLDWSVRRVL